MSHKLSKSIDGGFVKLVIEDVLPKEANFILQDDKYFITIDGYKAVVTVFPGLVTMARIRLQGSLPSELRITILNRYGQLSMFYDLSKFDRSNYHGVVFQLKNAGYIEVPK